MRGQWQGAAKALAMVGKLGGKSSVGRRLRRNATDVERKLWSRLRGAQLMGVEFRRQLSIGPYFADFGSLEPTLIVELDGGQHAEDPKEPQRTADMEKHGFHLLRFWNHEVNDNIDGVLQMIAEAIQQLHFSAGPSPGA